MKIIDYYKIVFIIFIQLLMFTGCSIKDSDDKKITVVFRFDDPSAISSTQTEKKVIHIFKKHNASLTFGVIPYRCAGSTRDTSPQEVVALDLEKSNILSQAVQDGTIEIALHGYSHQMRDTEVWTEFSGLDYESQEDKLFKGKKLLETLIGVSINTFIPPYNTYDLNTLKALETLNFKTISAGIHANISKGSLLNFMPMTIRLHQIKTAVKRARESSDSEPLIVIMFHEYDFLKVEVKGIKKRLITFEELNRYVKWLSKQKDIQITTLSQAAKNMTDVSAKRFNYLQEYTAIKSIIPGFLRKSNSVYPEVSSLFITGLKTISIYLFVFIFGFGVAYFFLCRFVLKYMENIVLRISLSSIVILPIFYQIFSLSIQARSLAIYLFLIGMIFGLYLCFFKKRKVA